MINIILQVIYFSTLPFFRNGCCLKAFLQFKNSIFLWTSENPMADCDGSCFQQLKATHFRASSKQQALLDVLLQLIKTWPLTIGPCILLKTVQDIKAPFITLLLTPLKQKLVDFSIQNQSLKFLKKSNFGPFRFKIYQNHISLEHSNVDCDHVDHIIDQFLLTKSVKRSVMNRVGLLYFLGLCIKMIGFWERRIVKN